MKFTVPVYFSKAGVFGLLPFTTLLSDHWHLHGALFDHLHLHGALSDHLHLHGAHLGDLHGEFFGRECLGELLGFGGFMPSQIVRNQAEKFAAMFVNNRSRPTSAASPLGCCGSGTCGGESFWGSKLLTVTRCWREISLGEDSLGGKLTREKFAFCR